MANWEFLPNPGNEEEGLGHAGIETFKGAPYPGIARECSQNSLDAAARLPDGTPRPVHLSFRLLSLSAAEIPGLPALKKTLQICLDQAKTRNLRKDREFFERAVKVAGQSGIPVLSIEDYGTTGLVGPAVEGKPFHALVKSSGVSQKADADARGSFGIGKNAAFAISGLRTVFYSTLYGERGGETHLAQGKSTLVSHVEGNVSKRATGYWGKTNYMPVEGSSLLPEWLRRTEIGTTVASIGFVEEQDWCWQMVESLIRNFFSAIDKKAIRFTVQWTERDSIEIDDGTVAELFSRKEVRDAADSAGTTEDLDFSAAMLEALKSADAEILEEDFKDIGRFRITLLQREGFPRRMGILRNGMYIADNLRHFGHAMTRFPMSRDFAAVLEPADRPTGGRVRDMESPRHDEISAERIDDLPERRRLKGAMKKVGAWVREVIRAATTKPAEAEILLDEMNRFFSKPSAGPPMPDPANSDEDPEKLKISPRPSSPKPPVGTGEKGESGSSGGRKKASSTGGGKTTGERSGKGRGAVGGRGGSSIAYTSLRNFVPVAGNGVLRKIVFTPGASGTGRLELSAIGVSSDEALTIKSVNGQSGVRSPRVALTEGERIELEIEFEAPYSGPISLVLAQVEEETSAN